nr:uncharacterized protein LOC129444375 isoform X2 [Misgurnus anguillicaudatus]
MYVLPLSKITKRHPLFPLCNLYNISCPWLSGVLCEQRTTLRPAERKWHKSNNLKDLRDYQSLLSSFLASVTTAKTSYYSTPDHLANAESKYLDLILLDLSAAFDTVNHQIHLATLLSLRITDDSTVEDISARMKRHHL